MTREMADNFPERGYGAERPEAVEILPLDIGDLPADEVVPLLERAASRIEIVKPENEFWQGMKENLEGAASYIKAKKGELASKTFRAIAGASLVTSMLSACAEPGLTPKATEIHRTSEPVATEVVSVPTPEPTATKESPPTPVTVASGRPYPVTDADFFLGAGGAENDEERLRELGAGPDIDKIRAMGVAEMERSGINPENIEWITELNEQAESPSWTTMPRNKTTGHFLFPKITSGPEAGQLVRAGSIFAYLDREIGDDFFDWIELQNPEGMENLEQRLIGDRSGWIVIGAFNTEGKMLFWFNAEKDEWVPASDFVPEVPYKVEEGIIMEWRDGGWREAALPGGTREIAMIEQHEGSWYGIDTYDRAVVRLDETGEWEKYERPIRIATWAKAMAPEEVLEIIQEDLSPEHEKRLISGEGNVIEYGYLGEQEVEGMPERVTMDISGYVRGAFIFQELTPCFIIEIPYRYERQVITGMIPIVIDQVYSYVFKIPEGKNIEEAERERIFGGDLVRAFNDPEALGSQIVVRILWKQEPYPLSENDWFRLEIEKLGLAIKRNEALDAGAYVPMGKLWIPASLLE